MAMLIRGMAETKAALARLEVEVEVASPKAVEGASKVVASEMASRAPRDTGYLVSVLETDVGSAGEGATAKVGSNAPYDRYVQRGTRYMGAQPYGEQAAAAAAPGVVAAMTAVYKAAVEG